MAGPPVTVMPDVEMVIRTWARTLDLAVATGRVFLGIPKQAQTEGDPNAGFPLVVASMLSAPPDANVPFCLARMSFSIWGRSGRAGRDPVAAIAHRLAAEINAVTGWTGHPGASIDGASVVLGPSWRPDPDAHRPRYTLDAVFTIRPVSI